MCLVKESQGVDDLTGLRSACEVPVVCIVYNRARLVRKLIDSLRKVKPKVVLVVADGPKPGNTVDTEACAEVRTEVSRIDWDCTLYFDYAQSNMGCSERIVSGLNWAFTLVDRAIILEDDIDADPQFFKWTSRMLLAYEGRDDVAILCGHNPLVWWPNIVESTAGILSQRGGMYGWATWRSKWRAIQNFSIKESTGNVAYDISDYDFEPVLGALLSYYHEQVMRGINLVWDCDFSLRMVLSGHCAIISPVNLIHNLGVGPEATHTKERDDILMLLPRGLVPDVVDLKNFLYPLELILLPKQLYDQAYDRARTLLELMVCTRDPAMAKRLARCVFIPLPNDLRLHLLPFRHIDETKNWIEHLANAGVDINTINRWRHRLGGTDSLRPAGDTK
jgi:hypothetical protein